MLFRSNDTATTEIYTGKDTLSLHDALPISFGPPLDQPGPLQHLQMPRDRGPADGKGRGDIADAEFARGCQPLDDGAPGRIGKRREYIVEL